MIYLEVIVHGCAAAGQPSYRCVSFVLNSTHARFPTIVLAYVPTKGTSKEMRHSSITFESEEGWGGARGTNNQVRLSELMVDFLSLGSRAPVPLAYLLARSMVSQTLDGREDPRPDT